MSKNDRGNCELQIIYLNECLKNECLKNECKFHYVRVKQCLDHLHTSVKRTDGNNEIIRKNTHLF